MEPNLVLVPGKLSQRILNGTWRSLCVLQGLCLHEEENIMLSISCVSFFNLQNTYIFCLICYVIFLIQLFLHSFCRWLNWMSAHWNGAPRYSESKTLSLCIYQNCTQILNIWILKPVLCKSRIIVPPFCPLVFSSAKLSHRIIASVIFYQLLTSFSMG